MALIGGALTPSVGLLLGRNFAVLQAYEAEAFTLQTGGWARFMIAAPFESKMSAIASYPERLLLVIVLCGAPSIVPPQGRVTVRAVIAKLDNSGMFL